ncbi:Nucleotide-binding universal stress protein, UspA family [Collimonas sp. OK242]|uniref:universal stress protein n=1 Tax=Collimonas sp. OK242 TaxID=1798195 RepID=UPI000894AAD7|nr:universal stress protein [Collimonas sp. OK242]SDX27474.1 Nucleotide-binding universal stress protein, UspA family [Collimonas sp. OK242]
MFKHLLLPTDGSAASEAAIRQSILFAKETGATVTGVHVIPEYHVFSRHLLTLTETKEQFDKEGIAQADKFLDAIKRAAQEAGVPCDTEYVVSDHPYEAILKMAEDKGCDMITMASHGRKGMRGILAGSETQKVLTHGKKPVLVFR